MARHQREGRVHELAVDDVDVGPTHATDQHPDANLSRRWLRIRRVLRAQRLPEPRSSTIARIEPSVTVLSAGVPGYAVGAGTGNVSDLGTRRVANAGNTGLLRSGSPRADGVAEHTDRPRGRPSVHWTTMPRRDATGAVRVVRCTSGADA